MRSQGLGPQIDSSFVEFRRVSEDPPSFRSRLARVTDLSDPCKGVYEALEDLGNLGDGTELTTAETLEVLGRLHKIEVERFYDRRRIEWQLAFTLWAGLVAVGVFLVSNLPDQVSTWWKWVVVGIVIAALAVIVTLHFVFEAKAIVPGSERGRDIGYAMSTLQRRAIGLSDACPDDTYHPVLAHYWLVVVTFVLGILVLLSAIVKLFA